MTLPAGGDYELVKFALDEPVMCYIDVPKLIELSVEQGDILIESGLDQISEWRFYLI